LETLESLVTRNGVLTHGLLRKLSHSGDVLLNGSVVPVACEVCPGDVVRLDGIELSVNPVPGRDRLRVLASSPEPGVIPGLRRVHAGYHKCLTMYTRKVLDRVARVPFSPRGFRHFYHRADVFYRCCAQYAFSSISGHRVDLDRFEDVRVSRFIRDPRDLLVSGYFYHLRGAEDWCHITDPVDEDWDIVQGVVPAQLPRQQSFSEYLNSVPIEQGLLAEIEFRKRHYASMLDWPEDDHRVRLYRYEDIMGHEQEIMSDLMEFYQLPALQRKAGRYYAGRYSAAKKSGRKGHIRNASSGQWKQYFSARVNRRFNEVYGNLLERYGYPAESL
jgi:hypothetical protein